MLLQSQLFSITNVPEVYQRVVGVNGRSRVCAGLGDGESLQPGRIVLLDARHAYGAPLEELIVPFTAMTAHASAATDTSSTTPTQAAARAFQAPRERCTRELLGHIPVRQPMFTSPGRPNKRFCQYCSTSGVPARELFAGCVPSRAHESGAGGQTDLMGGFICEGYSEDPSYDELKGPPPVQSSTVLSGPPRAHCIALLQWEAGRQQAVLEQEQYQHMLAGEPSLQGRIQKVAGRLAGAVKHVRQYEPPSSHLEAIAEVPLVKLWHDAAATAAAIHNKQVTAGPDTDVRYPVVAAESGGRPPSQASKSAIFRDVALAALTAWFKNSFFKWTNNPPCSSCGSANTSGIGAAAPTPAEQQGQAGHVEVYSCSACSALTRFPRYNNPLTLIKSRQGRCGEWANAFVFLCTALGWDVRHVHDWTDHVWAEVWSPAQCKWLHVDPCENAIDAPLLYEAGWGKKLNWVIAMSPREVVDVTWRYTQNWEEVSQRRAEVPEAWLAAYVRTLDWQQWQHSLLHLPLSDDAPQASSSALGLVLATASDIAHGKAGSGPDTSRWLAARLTYLQRRRQLENIQMATNVLVKAGSLSAAEATGRLSGSLQWRLARAETGAGGGSAATSAPADAAPSHFSSASLVQLSSVHLLPAGFSSPSPPSGATGGDATAEAGGGSAGIEQEAAPASSEASGWELAVSCLASWGAITAALATLTPTHPSTGQASPAQPLLSIVWRPSSEVVGSHASTHSVDGVIRGATPGAALKSAGWRPQAVLTATSAAGTTQPALRGAAASTDQRHFPCVDDEIVSLVALPGTQRLLAVGRSGAVHALQPASAEQKQNLTSRAMESPITQANIKSFFMCECVVSSGAAGDGSSLLHSALVDGSLVALAQMQPGSKQLLKMSCTAQDCFDHEQPDSPQWQHMCAAFDDAVAVAAFPGASGLGASAHPLLVSADGSLCAPATAAPPLRPHSTSADLQLALGVEPAGGRTAPSVIISAGAAGHMHVTVSLPVPPPPSSGRGGSSRFYSPAALCGGPLHLVFKAVGEPLEAALLRGTGRIVKTDASQPAGTGWVPLREAALSTANQRSFSSADAAELSAAVASVPGLQPAMVPLLGKVLPPPTAVGGMWSTGQDRTACLDASAQHAELRQRLTQQLSKVVHGAAGPGNVLWRSTVPVPRVIGREGTSDAAPPIAWECVLVQWSPAPPDVHSLDAVQVLARSAPWHFAAQDASVDAETGWVRLLERTVATDKADSTPTQLHACAWGEKVLLWAPGNAHAQVLAAR